MKIWLLENGERTGPHEIYDIRDRISDGELSGEIPAWYEGADDWGKLADVPAYTSYFNKPILTEVPQGEKKSPCGMLEPLEREHSNADAKPDSIGFQNEPLEPVRRLFARLLDIFLYTVLLSIIKIQMGINPFLINDVFKGIIDYLPYVLLDGLAITYIGTTPGKWLLNIKLRNYVGQHIDLKTSLIRSVRVWVLGFALGSLFAFIALPFSYHVGSKYGKFLWDIPKNNVTRCGDISPTKLVWYIVICMSAFYLFMNSIPPEMMPDEVLETMKKYEK